MKNKIIVLLFCICVGGMWNQNNLSAQSIKTDSLLDLLSKTKEDTSKIKLLLNLADMYSDTSKRYATFLKALALAEKTKFKRGEVAVCNAIGYYYMFSNVNYPTATAWYTRSLKICTQENFRYNLAGCYHQLGVISMNFNDFETALDYFRKAIAINEEVKNERFLKGNYNMMGILYMQEHNFDSALFYLRFAEQLSIKGNMSTAVLYVNFSSCFISMKELDSARKYIRKTDSSYVAKHSSYGKHWVNLLNGEVELTAGNARGSIELLLEPYLYAKEHNDNELMNEILPPLIEAYKDVGDFKNGFLCQEKLLSLNDSINGSNNASAVLAIERKFEKEQQAEIEKLIQEKKSAIADSDKRRANSILLFVVSGLLLVVVFSVFLFNRFRVTQRQKKEIELQKNIVEEKQKEIIDSIHYAKRIQQSMMPTEKYIDRQLRKNIK